jgi:hypothetical protein
MHYNLNNKQLAIPGSIVALQRPVECYSTGPLLPCRRTHGELQHAEQPWTCFGCYTATYFYSTWRANANPSPVAAACATRERAPSIWQRADVEEPVADKKNTHTHTRNDALDPGPSRRVHLHACVLNGHGWTSRRRSASHCRGKRDRACARTIYQPQAKTGKEGREGTCTFLMAAKKGKINSFTSLRHGLDCAINYQVVLVYVHTHSIKSRFLDPLTRPSTRRYVNTKRKTKYADVYEIETTESQQPSLPVFMSWY